MAESKLPTLFGYQSNFIADWLAASYRRTALVWPAGAGVVDTFCVLIDRLTFGQRVLVIADRQEFIHQFVSVQRAHGASACVVDRYMYRQLQSTVDAASPIWVSSQVYALTSSLASQSDVALSLQRQPWDVLIFLDTSDVVTTKLVEGALSHADRVLWKVRPGTDPGSLDSSMWTVNHLTVRDLSRDRGLPASEGLQVVVRAHIDEPNPQEQQVANLIDELVVATKGTSSERLATSLRTRWFSSPAALESGLRRIEAEMSSQWPLWDSFAEDGDGDIPAVTDLQNAGDLSVARRIARDCIGALDALPNDRKLANLLDHLRSRDPQQSIGIFVRYRDTGAYLFAALEDEGVPCVLVHGAMPYSEVHSRMQKFLEEPGRVLVMTTAMLIGSDLRSVRDLVLYDAPATREVMSQLLAKFHLVGFPQLHVTVIADQRTGERTVDFLRQAGEFAV